MHGIHSTRTYLLYFQLIPVNSSLHSRKRRRFSALSQMSRLGLTTLVFEYNKLFRVCNVPPNYLNCVPCSFCVVVDLPNDFKVIGTKGSITIKAPCWASVELETPDGPKRFPLPPTDRPLNYENEAGLR